MEIPPEIELLLFGPFTMLLEICMQIYSVVFALSRNLTSKMYAKIINILCAGNTVLETIKFKGGFNPKILPLRTPLFTRHDSCMICASVCSISASRFRVNMKN